MTSGTHDHALVHLSASGRVEALERHVGEAGLYEVQKVDVLGHGHLGVGLDHADVVHAATRYLGHTSVHQRFKQARSHLRVLKAVVSLGRLLPNCRVHTLVFGVLAVGPPAGRVVLIGGDERVRDARGPAEAGGLHHVRLGEDDLEVLETRPLPLARRAAIDTASASLVLGRERRGIELAELATGVPAEAIQLPAIGESECVCLSARDCDYLFVEQCLNLLREWLVGFVVRVLRQVPYIIQT